MDLPPLNAPTSPSVTPRAASGQPTPAPRTSFDRVLARVGVELDRGEALVQRVVDGRAVGLDAAELIALQAGIYRYSEIVDLAAKFVDRAGSAVRTTIQSSGS
jgi:hypothetical protein